MDISKTKLSINYSNSERTIFLKCHAYKLAIVRAAEKSAKLHNIFAAKAMLSTLKARYHRLSVQLQVNKSSIQNKQTSTFTGSSYIQTRPLSLSVLEICVFINQVYLKLEKKTRKNITFNGMLIRN